MRIEALAAIPPGSILGVHCSGLQDAAIAVVGPDGTARLAVALADLTLRPRDGRWPGRLLEQVPWDKVRAVALGPRRAEDDAALAVPGGERAWPAFGAARPRVHREAPEFEALVAALPVEVVRFDPHECRAAACFHQSGLRRALTVTCDDASQRGPWAATAHDAVGDELHWLGGALAGSGGSPDEVLAMVTAILGLQPDQDEGRLVELAGDRQVEQGQIEDVAARLAHLLQEFGELVHWQRSFAGAEPGALVVDRHRAAEFRGRLRDCGDDALAACALALVEGQALAAVRHARSLAREPHHNVCLSGRVFEVARIRRRIVAEFDAGFVAPPMVGRGTALGAALLAVRRFHPGVSPVQRTGALATCWWSPAAKAGSPDSREANVVELSARLRRRELEVQQLTNEVSALRGSLTWKVGRVLDSLRRGDFRGFVAQARGALGPRVVRLAKRWLPTRRTKVQTALQRLAAPPRPVPALAELRSRVAAALPAVPPRVTAVVPCYNYQRLVLEAVASLRAQTYPNLEIVVVDDGSTDPETRAALSELEATTDVRVVRQSNRGLVGARMAGAAVANGEYLLFLDNDDQLEPEAVALLALHLIAHPEVAFAYPSQHFFGDQDLVWQPQDYNAYDLLWSNHPTVCALIRGSSFRAVGGYDAAMRFGWEDWEHWIALSARQQFGHAVPVPVFRHRRHGHTMTQQAASKGAALRATILDKHQTLYEPSRVTAIKRQWRPAVSVVVPFCNAHRWWDETLQSLRRQTLDDFEIVLVNDASDAPESLQLLAELRAQGGVRVVDRATRGDLSAARNTGVRAARGDFVFFLDPDDLLAPTALEQLAWLLLQSPEVGFTYSGVVHFGASHGVCIDEYDVERLKRENFLTSAAMVRKEVYVRAGGMEEGERLLFEDYDFWLRLASLGIHGKLLPLPLFFYRRHGSGRSAWVRERMSEGDMRRRLRERNPALWGDGKELPAHYAPMVLVEADPLAALTADLLERYRQDLGVPYESFRRANVPNPLPARHWCDERVHVLYLIPRPTIGGAERVDLDILQGLDPARYHVTLVAEFTDGDEWRPQFEQAVAESFLLPHLGGDKAKAAAFLDYLVISRNVDVVFNRNTYVGYEMSQRWASRPNVRFCDLIHLHNKGQDWCRGSLASDAAMHRRFLISADLRRHMAAQYGLDHARFAVVPCGVDTSVWSPAIVAAGRLRKELAIAAEVPLVGFVGRLHEQKDALRWLRVAEAVAVQDPAVQFVVVGDGPQAAALQRALRKSRHRDRIHLLGHRDEVPPLLRDFDLLLMTSRYEGVPLVAFEAMSLGVPVVATDVGGTRECVGDGLGEVVAVDATPDELARVVRTWLARRGDAALRQACRERIVSRFELRDMQRKYAEEFAELAAGCDRRARLREYQDRLMQRSIV